MREREVAREREATRERESEQQRERESPSNERESEGVHAVAVSETTKQARER